MEWDGWSAKTLETDIRALILKTKVDIIVKKWILSEIVFFKICNVSDSAKFGGRPENVITSLSTVLLSP